MKEITREKLDKMKIKLNELKAYERGIEDKYSTNYLIWSKACDAVNRYRRKFNKLVSQYDYAHGGISSAIAVALNN